MANDVSIVVEASLGDTLIKLDLAKHAVNDLGDASENAAVKQDAAAASTSVFQGALAGLNGVMSDSVPLIGGLSAPIGALPVVAIAAIAAVVALADAFGTLLAIVGDLVAPVTLVTGLLGSLGLGFVLAGMRAAKGGGDLQPFADKVDTLGSMFHKTTDILAHAFLPYLLKLAGAAQQALLFIDKLAKMPLAEAFKTMATQGVQKLNDFVNEVSKIVAKPIRLAFQIAFGTGKGGNEISTMVSDWWNRFQNFFLGETIRKPIELRPGVFKIKTTTVDGALQPFIDWFNRHDFTKQGIKIGHAILNGLKPLEKPLSDFFARVFADAAKTAAKAFGSIFLRSSIPYLKQVAQAIQAQLGPAWDWVKQKAGNVWQWVVTEVTNAMGAAKRGIESALGTAWDWVLTKAQGIWDKIVKIFTAPLHISLSVPHIPSLGSVVGGLNPFSSNVASNTASLAGGGGGMVINIHHGHFTDAASRRREAAAVGAEIARVWRQKAGG